MIELAKSNETLRVLISSWAKGFVTWAEAMTAAALHLAKENQVLEARLKAAEARQGPADGPPPGKFVTLTPALPNFSARMQHFERYGCWPDDPARPTA